MTDIQLRSDMGVSYVHHMGSDQMIADAARVSTRTDGEERPHEALVRRLWTDGHTSPFEHTALTVRAEVPIFVAREWMRHRTQAFNEVSGRYSELEPVFYLPGDDRPLVQSGKAMDYRREAGDADQADRTDAAHSLRAIESWRWYQVLLNNGIAREVARNVLPVSLYTSFYATANLNNWLKFLTLRTDETALYEIREAASQVEAIIADLWPVTYGAWRGKA
ncbi:FAD-dependent thymidylate synthase [Brevibacterium album]|uniref:FAD-dependent thymidylate synthase n=1 Tax=Brevibacterium album TaxID=417948 RepID=UPI00048EFA39|nr:FAD-dependent thymidylate synthase [Brevibacterium album]